MRNIYIVGLIRRYRNTQSMKRDWDKGKKFKLIGSETEVNKNDLPLLKDGANVYLIQNRLELYKL